MEALRSKQKLEEQRVQSAIASKVKANPEEETKSGAASQVGSKTKALQNASIEGLPEDMICAICCNARRTVMI